MLYLPLPTPETCRPGPSALRVLVDPGIASMYRYCHWAITRRSVSAPVGRGEKTLHELVTGSCPIGNMVRWYDNDDILDCRIDNCIFIKQSERKKRLLPVTWSAVVCRWLVWHHGMLMAAVEREKEATLIAEHLATGESLDAVARKMKEESKKERKNIADAIAKKIMQKTRQDTHI